jgi:hypothetical protein
MFKFFPGLDEPQNRKRASYERPAPKLASRAPVTQLTIDDAFKAIDEGNARRLSTYLKQSNANINALKGDQTLLMRAVQNMDARMIRILLAQPSIQINQANSKGKTALMVAALYEYNEGIEIILNDAGINPYQEDQDAMSAYFYAVRKGNRDSIHLFLKKSPSDYPISSKRETDICIASKWASSHVLTLLLNHYKSQLLEHPDKVRALLSSHPDYFAHHLEARLKLALELKSYPKRGKLKTDEHPRLETDSLLAKKQPWSSCINPIHSQNYATWLNPKEPCLSSIEQWRTLHEIEALTQNLALEPTASAIMH